MGYSQAYNIAQQTDLETTVHWHLTANCYPPVPNYMEQVCIDAIDAVLDDDYNRQIDLPDGVTYHNLSTAPAHAIVENFRLDGIIDGINNKSWDFGEDWEE